MASTRSRSTTRALRYLTLVIAMPLVCVIYVAATERSKTASITTRSTTGSHYTRSHQLQVSRMRSRLRTKKGHPNSASGEGCFATTESEARDKLIQNITAADPVLWDPTTDYSNWLPSTSSFVCTEGLRQEEIAGITAALNTHTHIEPRLTINLSVENAPEVDEGHAIIQGYLGRERYVEHMANCLRKTQSDNRDADAKLDRTMAQLLKLSTEQQRALKPLQVRLRSLHGPAQSQALDETGALVTLDDRPHMESDEELQALLDIAERGFSLLTEDQARAYRELATGTAYGEVLAQYKLTQSFLPIPEEIREIIRSMEEFHGSQPTP